MAEPREATCPACGAHVAVPFFDGGNQPLATLGWPHSESEATTLPRLPLDYVRCAMCGHVYNARFDYQQVPYAAKPTLMFNRGFLWAEFIRNVIDELARSLSKGATVVELGHGDGTFLTRITELRSDVKCLGFDPHGVESRTDRLELRRALVQPEAVPALDAEIFIARHVLEHLTSPLKLLQRLGFAAARANKRQRIYIEVPCIDRAIESRRTTDFFYEHCSQFTTRSFLTMIERAGGSLVKHGHGYDGEVIWALADLGRSEQAAIAREALDFDERTRASRAAVRAQLETLLRNKKRIAVWGGTGKSGAFLVRHEMDRERFPLVVDSDATKVGTYVAGTGQRIGDPSELLRDPIDVVIVPPQWRARDIVLEMREKGIACDLVLIEHDGRLIDFLRDAHPYAKPA